MAWSFNKSQCIIIRLPLKSKRIANFNIDNKFLKLQKLWFDGGIFNDDIIIFIFILSLRRSC